MISNLYDCDCPHCQDLSDVSQSFKLNDDVIAKALENIYRKEFNPQTEIEPGLFSATWKAFNQAANEGFAKAHFNPSGVFEDEIRYHNAVFSAFRIHRQQNDMAARLLDENGELKSFDKWVKEVKSISDHYNKTWLQTEYNTAVIRAHRAADWKQYEAESDVYPNLQWMPSTSPNPGEDHRIYWGTIRPINDHFWTEHKPGDRWNCKCWLQQTGKAPTKNHVSADKEDMPMPGLENNPADDGKLFSKSHPYYTETYPGAEKAVQNFLKEEHIFKAEVYKTETFKSGGKLETPTVGKQNKNEAVKNKKVYTELAKKHGEHYRLLPVSNVPGIKYPDALNIKMKKKSDAKVPTTKNGKNAIQSAISEASRQRVDEVVIFLEKDYPMVDIWQGLKAALQSGRAKSIQTIIIRFNNNELKRYNSDKLRKVFYKRKGK